jgi:hypothetical protein
MTVTPEQVIQILGSTLLISELLAQIPWIKANSIFQLITGVLRSLLKKKN